jgi:hypothetical protein
MIKALENNGKILLYVNDVPIHEAWIAMKTNKPHIRELAAIVTTKKLYKCSYDTATEKLLEEVDEKFVKSCKMP